jgi:ATP-dependent Clp protease ATP-binding subunit ClpA
VVDKFLIELEAQLESKKVTLEVDSEGRSLAGQARLRSQDGRAADGADHSGKYQAPTGRGAVYSAGLMNGGHVLVTVRDGDLQVEIAEEEAVP